jgi:hypothetical protein
MTWWLVQGSSGHIYESNPFANAWLARFGWLGLVVYKALAMGLVGGVAVFVAHYRPRVAGRLLVFACAMTAGVVVYSGYLSVSASPVHREEDQMAQQLSQALDEEMDKQQTYRATLTSLSKRLARQEFSLDEAVTQLASTEKANNPRWVGVLMRSYPGRNKRECLTIHLGYYALNQAARQGPDQRDQLASRLEDEYLEQFGSEFHFDPAHLAHGHTPPKPTSEQSAPYTSPSAAASLSFAVVTP